MESTLIFDQDTGIGFYPVPHDPSIYNKEYLDRYRQYSLDDPGINNFRVGWVSEIIPSVTSIIDIGVGDGAFIREMLGRGYAIEGWDINPIMYDNLEKAGLLRDPRDETATVHTFFDSFEHLYRPQEYLNCQECFISIPIFENKAHILRSKHFKKNEHYWYFTMIGLINFMAHHGFACHDYKVNETALGREGIGSFYFKRMKDVSKV